ncbi:TetR/AcrR family transcriptional regulator [Ilumatobacter sp.]|uniref:TetR/AcrR family transcriptional regulator n=1 Tax=Ilumatobacter sp. TaxID=1967498 RepID=UPI003B51C038
MTEPAKRGRPRSEQVGGAVLTAALELAGEVGIAKMSMDELARRADVSKATIYRRWSSKEELVLDALRSAISPIDDVDTGSLRGDLDRFLEQIVARFEQSSMNDVLPHLIEAACHDRSIQASLDDWVRVRRLPLRGIYERAAQRGDIDADADIEVLIDATIGPFVYRRLLTRQPIDAGFASRLVALVAPAAPS